MTSDLDYSVLMSIYKNDDLESVKRSIDSIYGQLVKSNDVVVVFDGPVKTSVDEFVTRHCSGWNIIRLPKNVGLGDALRIGLPKCKNKWVLRMDADDFCPSFRSERLLEALFKKDNSNIAAIGSFITERNPDTQETALIKYPLSYQSKGKVNYFRDPIGHASAMINRDAIEEVGGYRKCLYFEDTYLWLRLLKHGYFLVTIPEILYEARVDTKFYRRRSGFRYGLLELQNFFRFYVENLITFRSFFLNATLRPIVRMLPKSLVKIIYLTFLRSNKKRI